MYKNVFMHIHIYMHECRIYMLMHASVRVNIYIYVHEFFRYFYCMTSGFILRVGANVCFYLHQPYNRIMKECRI